MDLNNSKYVETENKIFAVPYARSLQTAKDKHRRIRVALSTITGMRLTTFFMELESVK